MAVPISDRVCAMLKTGMTPTAVGKKLGLEQNWVVFYGRRGGVLEEKKMSHKENRKKPIPTFTESTSIGCVTRRMTVMEAIEFRLPLPWAGKVEELPEELLTEDLLCQMLSCGLSMKEINKVVKR